MSSLILGVVNSPAFKTAVAEDTNEKTRKVEMRESHMLLTGKHMSRRTVLRGLGVTIALPLFDAMIPARKVFAQTAAGKAAAQDAARLHRAGARRGRLSRVRRRQRVVEPARDRAASSISSKGSLGPLEPFRDYLTIISNTDSRMAEASRRLKLAATTSGRAR